MWVMSTLYKRLRRVVSVWVRMKRNWLSGFRHGSRRREKLGERFMLSVRMVMVRREPASAVPGSDMHDSLVTLLFYEWVSYTH